MEEKEQLQVDMEKQILDYLKQGDLVYELYAVLVHSGGAAGGHYYAYIKSFEDSKWYNFNDSSVCPIQAEDITKVFGDASSTATAYMLLYRQYNPQTMVNPVTIPESVIPEYLKTEIDEETNKMIEEQLQIEEKLMTLKLRVWHGDIMKEITCRKDNCFSELCRLVGRELGI